MGRERASLTSEDFEVFADAEAAAQAMCARTREAVALLEASSHLVKASAALHEAFKAREFRDPDPHAASGGHHVVSQVAEHAMTELADASPEVCRSQLLKMIDSAQKDSERRPDCKALVDSCLTVKVVHGQLVAEVVRLSFLGLPWPQERQDEVLVNVLAYQGWSDAQFARVCSELDGAGDTYDRQRMFAGRARRRRAEKTRELAPSRQALDDMRREVEKADASTKPRALEQMEWWLTSMVQFQVAAMCGKPELVRVPWKPNTSRAKER